jgi:hypothetical protein
MADSPYSVETEAKLAEFIAQFYDDPYGFVMAVFPWGQPTLPDGSPNPLADKDGPEAWQRDLLIAVGEHIKQNSELRQLGLSMEVWRSAVASGHGVGKSAIVAWLIYFFMSTRRNTRGAVTASTQFQLEDKTWPELAKWHALAINKHWFNWTATALTFAQIPEDQQKNYRIVAATVSEHKTEAFAGLHNERGSVIIIFDEASGVLPKLWEVVQGALSDGEAFFFAFGNPTQPDGPFYDCFDKHKEMYWLKHVDSRHVRHTNKNALNDTIKLYGPDSDEAKVRVYGQFPRQALNGFMPVDAVRDAMQREAVFDAGAGLIMAVDISGAGDDEFVMGWRQGRDYRSIPQITLKGSFRTPQIVEMIAEQINRTRPDAIVIEMVGTGVAVVDYLRDRGYKVHGVFPGTPPDGTDDRLVYYNKRIYWWACVRQALYDGLCLPDDPVLFSQLTTVQYLYDRQEQKMLLEPKKELKDRGLPSPDRADTLALTYAVTVPRRDVNAYRPAQQRSNMSVTDYDPFGYGVGQ